MSSQPESLKAMLVAMFSVKCVNFVFIAEPAVIGLNEALWFESLLSP